MITEQATVISSDKKGTWIETQRKSSCGQCSANKGCGTSVLSKVIGNKFSTMKAINKIDAKVGDKVIIALNEGSLLKGAFMTYMLPLLYIFAFSWLGQFCASLFSLDNNELLIIIFAISGFYLAIKQLKRFSASIAEDEDYQPVIIKQAEPFSIIVEAKSILEP